MNSIIKRQQPPPSFDLREIYIAYMFVSYLRAPGRKTLPGEVVDLQEIGSVREKNWTRATPYSLAQPKE